MCIYIYIPRIYIYTYLIYMYKSHTYVYIYICYIDRHYGCIYPSRGQKRWMVHLVGGESRGISEARGSQRAGNAGRLKIFQGWTSETDAGRRFLDGDGICWDFFWMKRG